LIERHPGKTRKAGQAKMLVSRQPTKSAKNRTALMKYLALRPCASRSISLNVVRIT